MGDILKVKVNNEWVGIPAIKGDPGDPSELIDDTAGSGDTGKTWSADKIVSSIPSVPVTDVKANGTSIVSSGVANIPMASGSVYGVISYGAGLSTVNDKLTVSMAGSSVIKEGTNAGSFIRPYNQHESVFYGLAKAAGDSTQASSDNAVGNYTDNAKASINTMIGSVAKTAIDNTGITAKTYTTKFDGEFSVTTAAEQDWQSPHALASVTGRINKENLHSVTYNGTEYILPTRLWYQTDGIYIKVYEYLGNLGLFISNVSGVPDGTDNVPFVIISDLDNNSSIDVLTQTAGTCTFLVKQINFTKKTLPRTLIYGDEYAPIVKNNNGGTYNGFSIGVNQLNNKRATLAFGYGNSISDEFSFAVGTNNVISNNNGYAVGRNNTLTSNGYAIGDQNNVSGSLGFAFGDSLAVNGSKMFAIGSYNVEANTTFPNFQTNTLYRSGDIVSGKWISSLPNLLWVNTKTHTSSSSQYLSDDKDENNVSYWRLSPSTGDAMFVVGNGNGTARSNAMKIDVVGNCYIKGDLYANCESNSTGGTKVATVDDVALKAPSANPVFTGSISLGRKANTTVGSSSVAIGYDAEASASYSTAIGVVAKATQMGATAFGSGVASGSTSFAEGIGTASGVCSHAEGSGTTSSGSGSHAEGYYTTASNFGSHSEGYYTTASDSGSHAEGYYTVSSGLGSHASGRYTTSCCAGQMVGGNYNVSDTAYTNWAANTSYSVDDKVSNNGIGYICEIAHTSSSSFDSSKWNKLTSNGTSGFIIGNGTDADHRSNALTLTWTGDLHLNGDVYTNASSDGSGGSKVATESYVTTRVPTPPVADGTYYLKCVVSNGTPTYSWATLPSANGVSF